MMLKGMYDAQKQIYKESTTEKYEKITKLNPSLLEEKTLILTEDDMICNSSGVEVCVPLSNIEKMVVNKNNLHIVKEDGSVLQVVPLNAFKNQQEMDAFIGEKKKEVCTLPNDKKKDSPIDKRYVHVPVEKQAATKGNKKKRNIIIVIVLVVVIASMVNAYRNIKSGIGEVLDAASDITLEDIYEGINLEVDGEIDTSNTITYSDALRIQEKKLLKDKGEEVEPEDTALKQFMLDLEEDSTVEDVKNMAVDYGLEYYSGKITIIGEYKTIEVWEPGSRYNRETGEGVSLEVEVYNKRSETPGKIKRVRIQTKGYYLN